MERRSFLKQAGAGLKTAGVKLGETDFATIARGFGGFGVFVENSDDLRAELEAAGLRQEFTLIACKFDVAGYDNAF